jgi:large conductance mechanosensitive channel
MQIYKEFKDFALRGNVIDMAVGIVIGSAFTAVVKSMVDSFLMPVLGAITGQSDFSNRFIVLTQGSKAPGPYLTLKGAHDAGANVLTYGVFADTIVHFILVAVALFFLIRWINRLTRKPTAQPEIESAPTTKTCEYCKTDIAIDASRCPHCTSELAAV